MAEVPSQARPDVASVAPAEAAVVAPELPSMLRELRAPLQVLVLGFLDARSLDSAATLAPYWRPSARNHPEWKRRALLRHGKDDVRLWLRKEGLLRAGCGRTLAVPLWAWREVSVRIPQLRQDGIYVARCVYTRRIARGSSLTDR